MGSAPSQHSVQVSLMPHCVLHRSTTQQPGISEDNVTAQLKNGFHWLFYTES